MPSYKNSEMLETVIRELDDQIKILESNIAAINNNINKIKVQKKEILSILDDNQLINPKKVAKHMFDVNESFNRLINIEELDILKARLKQAVASYEELNSYYKNQYLKTMEESYYGDK